MNGEQKIKPVDYCLRGIDLKLSVLIYLKNVACVWSYFILFVYLKSSYLTQLALILAVHRKQIDGLNRVVLAQSLIDLKVTGVANLTNPDSELIIDK